MLSQFFHLPIWAPMASASRRHRCPMVPGAGFPFTTLAPPYHSAALSQHFVRGYANSHRADSKIAHFSKCRTNLARRSHAVAETQSREIRLVSALCGAPKCTSGVGFQRRSLALLQADHGRPAGWTFSAAAPPGNPHLSQSARGPRVDDQSERVSYPAGQWRRAVQPESWEHGQSRRP